MPYHSIDVHDLDKAQTIAVRVRITAAQDQWESLIINTCGFILRNP